jgi:hypothetical protein
MNNIFCFGDGSAASHIWPEWPVIISALYNDIKNKNFGAIGAGNEFITSAVVEAHKEDPTAFFLIQWAQHNRFDKLLQDDLWSEIIKTDPVYYFNTVELNKNQWWISSASTQKDIQHYHKHYIQTKQSELRTANYKYLLLNLLKNQSIFFSTEDMEVYSRQPRFKDVRQKEVQPTPIIHMAYVEEKILPLMPIQPNAVKVRELKTRIETQPWIPYDPDRVQIWENIINF